MIQDAAVRRRSRPAVVNERIAQREIVEVSPVVQREREQFEIRPVVQRVQEVVQQPDTFQDTQFPREIRELRDTRPEPALLPHQPTVTTLPPIREYVTMRPYVRERVVRHVVEDIQPVIDREIRATTHLRATKPIYEHVVESPRVVGASATLPPIAAMPASTATQPLASTGGLVGGAGGVGGGPGYRTVQEETGFQQQQQQPLAGSQQYAGGAGGYQTSAMPETGYASTQGYQQGYGGQQEWQQSPYETSGGYMQQQQPSTWSQGQQRSPYDQYYSAGAGGGYSRPPVGQPSRYVPEQQQAYGRSGQQQMSRGYVSPSYGTSTYPSSYYGGSSGMGMGMPQTQAMGQTAYMQPPQKKGLSSLWKKRY